MWERPRTLLSLFDASGSWCRPFEAAGWNVVQVDLQLGDDLTTWSATSLLEGLLQSFDTIDGILAAPPCTDFTNAGAQYWPEKDADGRTAVSVHLVRQVLRIVDFLQPDFWALENPVGRLPKLVPSIGQPRLSFDPYEFAGWTDPTPADLARLASMRARGAAGPFTPDEIALVREVGAYTKRTQLWGSFRLPVLRPVPAVATSSQGSWLQSLGGKGAETKYQRSLTPIGFARAFAAAQLGQEAAPTQMDLFGLTG